MKRQLIGLFTVLVSIIVLKPSCAFANDGLLHINTDISQGKETKEIYYIEQETDLSKLFNSEVTAQVKYRQEQVAKKDVAFKEGIFLEVFPQNDWSQDYQQLLFNPETELAVASDYSVQLTPKKTDTPMGMLALFSAGLGVMIWSVVQTKKRKGS